MSIFVSYIPHGEGTSTRTGIDCQKLSDFTCGKRAARLAGEDPERRIGRLPRPPIAAPGSFASDAVRVRQFPALLGVALGLCGGRENERADGQGDGKGQASHGPSLPLSPAGANNTKGR